MAIVEGTVQERRQKPHVPKYMMVDVTIFTTEDGATFVTHADAERYELEQEKLKIIKDWPKFETKSSESDIHTWYFVESETQYKQLVTLPMDNGMYLWDQNTRLKPLSFPFWIKFYRRTTYDGYDGYSDSEQEYEILYLPNIHEALRSIQ